jgi:hypothetical protein
VQSGPGIRRNVTSWHSLGFVILPHKSSTSLLFEVQENLKKFMRNHGMCPSMEIDSPLWPWPRAKEFFDSPPAIPPFRLFADRDMQRQDGASDPTDDAEKKDENEGDEDAKRHRLASVC